MTSCTCLNIYPPLNEVKRGVLSPDLTDSILTLKFPIASSFAHTECPQWVFPHPFHVHVDLGRHKERQVYMASVGTTWLKTLGNGFFPLLIWAGELLIVVVGSFPDGPLLRDTWASLQHGCHFQEQESQKIECQVEVISPLMIESWKTLLFLPCFISQGSHKGWSRLYGWGCRTHLHSKSIQDLEKWMGTIVRTSVAGCIFQKCSWVPFSCPHQALETSLLSFELSQIWGIWQSTGTLTGSFPPHAPHIFALLKIQNVWHLETLRVY